MMKRLLQYLLFAFLLISQKAYSQCPPPGFPPPGDGCPQAPVLCQDMNGYCATLGTNNVQQEFPGCPGNALNNDEWFAFIAGSSSITLQIVPSNCQGTGGGTGMQGAVYEGGCGGTPIATQCNCTDVTFELTGSFVPGQVYYVVFDGCAGDICDFQVNVTSGSTAPQPPENPSAIIGPTAVCPGSNATYSLANQNAATFDWQLTPASMGSISGSPGGEIMVNWSQAGTAQLCVTSSNPCFAGGTECITVTSTDIPDTVLPPVTICQGETVICAGIPFSGPTGPTGFPVPLTNYLGCDSTVICFVNQLAPIITNLGQVTLCAPATYSICGVQYFSTDSGISHTCPNASWQGCDSIVNVDLAILNPEAFIEEPTPVVGCGANAEVVLVGTGSDLSTVPGSNTTISWTGPGILGASNGLNVTVNQAGQYCLTITTSRGNVSCTSTKCVTVISNIQLPNQPQISGNQNPCQGVPTTYSVTPVGSPAPTGYNWTTPAGVPFTVLSPTSISVTWPTTTGGQVCVEASNDCGVSVPACLAVTISPSAPAPVIAGPTSVCANTITQVFNITNSQPGITYSWTVPAGATYTGAGTNSITVNFANATAGPGQVCATAQNACGTSQPVCYDITITGIPPMPVMTGPGSVCSSGGNYTYTVSNPPAGVTYNWTVPAGATLTGTGASVSVNFNGASNGQVCVTAQNSCGTSAPACQSVQVTTAPTGTISGSGTICQGSSDQVNLTITLTGQGPWDVSYSLNNGAATNINVTTSPYTLSVAQAGTYTLTAVGITGTNCPGTFSGSAVVTQNPAPVATLSGTGSICAGSGNTVPLTISFTGSSPWTIDWTLNGGAQAPFQATTNPYTWNIGEAQAGAIALADVVDGNGCNGTTVGSATVTVEDAPTVSGIMAPCDANNQFFSVSFTINGGDPGSYSVTPLNGTLSGNTFTSNPIASGSGYSFVVTDANDCNPVTVAQAIVLCDCDSEVGTMDGATVEVCGNGPTQVQYDTTGQAFDGNDALAFVLHNGSGLSIVAPVLSTSSTPTASFNPATMTYGTTYYLSAVVGDGNGSGGVLLTDPCLQVAQGTPIVFNEIPTATLSGSDAICEGETGQLSVAFTGEGPWSISYDDGSGNIQTLNGITQNPYSLTLTPTATSNYCLTAVTDNNCPGTVTGCGVVTVNTGIQMPTDVLVECNLTSTAYTVSFTITGGDPATYTVTGVTGTLTGNLFTSDPIPSGTGYSILVNDINNCDPQTIAQTLVDCDCTTDAGSMSTTPVTVCGDGPQTVGNANAVPDADDVIQYVLRPDNFAQLGTVLATSNTPTFSFIPGTMVYGTTYYISAIVGNNNGSGAVDLADPCLDVSSATPIVFREIPTATLTGSQTICEGETASLSVTLTGASPWTIVYQAGATGAPTTVTANTSPFQIPVTPNATTTYSLVSVSSSSCTGTVNGTATVTVTNPPTIANLTETCDAAGQTFVISFQIQGGDPTSYTVSPSGTIVGNIYTGGSLPDGATYTYNVDDANGCGPTVVTGAFSCNCTTESGTMSSSQVQVCIDEMATITAPTGTVLDVNDLLVYVLHTGNSNTLGTVISTSSTPTFSFNPNIMTTGTVYYVSAVAGNNSGNGSVNLLDPCLDISVGTPIVFNALPTISVAGTTTICDGESAQLTLTVTGTGPFTVNFSVNGAPQAPQTIPVAGTFPLPPITTTTTVALISITDVGTGCINTSTQTATVTVNPNVGAGTSLGDLTFCQGAAQAFDLDDQITGQTLGGQWTGPSGVVSGGAVNPANFPPGNYPFTYTVQGTGNCPDDMVTVNLTINPGPIADAGVDQTLTCDILTANLGSTATTAGAIYNWSGGVVADSTASITTTTQAGVYTLTVDDAGCISTDEVEIQVSAAVPSLSIVISDVSCFGENDGFLSVDSVWGGTSPYLFSLDGSPFSNSTQFSNLGQGSFTISVMDAGGCTSESSFTVDEPVEVTVEITGNFEGNSNIIDLGDELVLSILATPSSNELDSILWSTQGIDSCQTCPSITVSPTQQTTYTVLVDEGGCTASDDLTVVVKKDRPVYIPNAFSPNDDGLNDLFMIYAGKSVKEIKSFLVFNRWGESIYQYFKFTPNDPAVGWDGTHRGKKMQPAVFTWFAEIEFTDGRIEVYKGDVSLLR